MFNRNLASAIRFLSIDAVQKAKSGHPGMPMGMADIATILWRKYLKHNPKNPQWYNRDRFILSNGHGSMLLYSLLHLTGYDLSINDLKEFRQLGSKTPGHPEYNYTPGVETTTGPLGQGLANSIGMALAEKILGQTYNKPGYKIIDHYTYVFVGDGCLMEGISHEVSSLAGTLRLGNLIAFWDQNNISIDGKISGWFDEDVASRYEAYGWQVIRDVDGHDFDSIDKAIFSAQRENNKPTLICCKTIIGFGSPNKANSNNSHGSPLGEEEIKKTRESLNWHYKAFEIPENIYENWNMSEEGEMQESKWKTQWEAYKIAYPKEFIELNARINRIIPNTFNEIIKSYINELFITKNKIATRKASQMFLEKFTNFFPDLFGGSADLTGSNLTNITQSKWVNSQDFNKANYLSYGVREFGMSAMMNGISLYGGFRPYGGTFLVFSDYARNAIRMSAIMKQCVIYVMTHDSIGLGEDGPTHQPIEHLTSLRLIPNLNVWRPADVIETTIAWESAIKENNSPSILALCRQNIPMLVNNKCQINGIKKGGYLLRDNNNAKISLLSTGSEVEIMLKTADLLNKQGIQSNVISMPCLEKFLCESQEYQNSIILPNLPLLIMEAGHKNSWYPLLLNKIGDIIGLNHYGESAPAEDIYNKFNLTPEYAMKKAKELLGKKNDN